jgi:hypothetical protein
MFHVKHGFAGHRVSPYTGKPMFHVKHGTKNLSMDRLTANPYTPFLMAAFGLYNRS